MLKLSCETKMHFHDLWSFEDTKLTELETLQSSKELNMQIKLKL